MNDEPEDDDDRPDQELGGPERHLYRAHPVLTSEPTSHTPRAMSTHRHVTGLSRSMLPPPLFDPPRHGEGGCQPGDEHRQLEGRPDTSPPSPAAQCFRSAALASRVVASGRIKRLKGRMPFRTKRLLRQWPASRRTRCEHFGSPLGTRCAGATRMSRSTGATALERQQLAVTFSPGCALAVASTTLHCP
jgi:hypothetical protein